MEAARLQLARLRSQLQQVNSVLACLVNRLICGDERKHHQRLNVFKRNVFVLFSCNPVTLMPTSAYILSTLYWSIKGYISLTLFQTFNPWYDTSLLLLYFHPLSHKIINTLCSNFSITFQVPPYHIWSPSTIFNFFLLKSHIFYSQYSVISSFHYVFIFVCLSNWHFPPFSHVFFHVNTVFA